MGIAALAYQNLETFGDAGVMGRAALAYQKLKGRGDSWRIGMLAFSQGRCPLGVRPRGGTLRCQGTTKSTWHKQKSRYAERVMFLAYILAYVVDSLWIVIYTVAGALQPSAGLDRTTEPGCIPVQDTQVR